MDYQSFFLIFLIILLEFFINKLIEALNAGIEYLISFFNSNHDLYFPLCELIFKMIFYFYIFMFYIYKLFIIHYI